MKLSEVLNKYKLASAIVTCFNDEGKMIKLNLDHDDLERIKKLVNRDEPVRLEEYTASENECFRVKFFKCPVCEAKHADPLLNFCEVCGQRFEEWI